MIQSMTGFGTYTINTEQFCIRVEVLCLNKKNFELHMNCPKNFMFAEIALRKITQNILSRGKVTVLFNINLNGTQKKVRFNEELLIEWNKMLQIMKKKFDYKDDLGVKDWLNNTEIWTIEEDTGDYSHMQKDLEHALEHALEQVIKMRKNEGKTICSDFKEKINELTQIMKDIKTIAPHMVALYEKKIKKQVKNSSSIADQEKDLFHKFVSVFSEKVDIEEELVRLLSHTAQFKSYMKKKEPVGRTLDFLLQEMIREVNTIGSKACDSQIRKNVIAMKTIVEQMREQVQNVL